MRTEISKKFVSLLAVGFFAFPILVWGASDFKEPTVSDCVERAGFSEEKCSEMLEKMKDMGAGERGAIQPGGSKNGQNEPSGNFSRGEEQSQNVSKSDLGGGKMVRGERTERIRAEEEQRFSRMGERIEKIINFLESKGINVDELKENLETFADKADAVLGAIDDYISILKNAQDDDSAIEEKIKEARGKIHTLMEELKNFYQLTLKENLKSKLEELK
jgi:hypothetical protein